MMYIPIVFFTFLELWSMEHVNSVSLWRLSYLENSHFSSNSFSAPNSATTITHIWDCLKLFFFDALFNFCSPFSCCDSFKIVSILMSLGSLVCFFPTVNPIQCTFHLKYCIFIWIFFYLTCFDLTCSLFTFLYVYYIGKMPVLIFLPTPVCISMSLLSLFLLINLVPQYRMYFPASLDVW